MVRTRSSFEKSIKEASGDEKTSEENQDSNTNKAQLDFAAALILKRSSVHPDQMGNKESVESSAKTTFHWALDSELLKKSPPGEPLQSPIYHRWAQKWSMQVYPSAIPNDPHQLSLKLLGKPDLPFRVRVKYSFINWKRPVSTSYSTPFEHVFDDDDGEGNLVCAACSLEGDFDSICCEIERTLVPAINTSSVGSMPPCKKPRFLSVTCFKPSTKPTVSMSEANTSQFISVTSDSEDLEEDSGTSFGSLTESNIVSSTCKTLTTETGTNIVNANNGHIAPSTPKTTADASLKSPVKLNKSYRHLCRDIGKLFHSSEYSDVVLIVRDDPDDALFRAHKAIISARSSVFSRLCRKYHHEIVLDGISKEILEKIMEFMYCGSVSNLQNHHCGIFSAAKKYALLDLKEMCIKSMMDNISYDNAAEILINAHEHKLEDLKLSTMHFMNKNASQVVKTTGYKNMLESHKNLIADLYHCLLVSNVAGPDSSKSIQCSTSGTSVHSPNVSTSIRARSRPSLSNQAIQKAKALTLSQQTSIVKSLLVDKPPGTTVNCLDAEVIKTSAGWRIILKGLENSNFTPTQCSCIHQKIKEYMVQNIQDNKGVGPHRFCIVVQPGTSAVRVHPESTETIEN